MQVRCGTLSRMRRLIVAVAVAVALTLGSAAPASAHHTHSPTTLCNAYRPSGYTSLTPHSHYTTSGHPATAHCYYRNNVTFSTIQRCRWYSNHALVSLSIGCPH